LIRLGIPLFGGRQWMGGFNYLENLLLAIGAHCGDQITGVVFVGAGVDPELEQRLRAIRGAEIVVDDAFDDAGTGPRLAATLATGVDAAAAAAFQRARIDLAFETARFFGARCPVPALAWMPDFQHRRLRNQFSAFAYWRRDLGFRLQAGSGRLIMLSSRDARGDCERFYPAARGHTAVVHFAPRPGPRPTAAAVAQVRARYSLPQRYFFLPNQFWTHKNHETVIRALAIARTAGKPAVVVMTGAEADPRDPGHAPRLRALIETLGVQDDARLLGLAPHEDIAPLLAGCEALINPSLSEGWSTAVEEAKAVGAPMILSDIPVHREQAAGAASFFEPASPERLAAILMLTLCGPPSGREDPQALEGRAKARFRAFAADFAAAAHRAVDGEANGAA
jgi:hypothetical protein